MKTDYLKYSLISWFTVVSAWLTIVTFSSNHYQMHFFVVPSFTLVFAILASGILEYYLEEKTPEAKSKMQQKFLWVLIAIVVFSCLRFVYYTLKPENDLWLWNFEYTSGKIIKSSLVIWALCLSISTSTAVQVTTKTVKIITVAVVVMIIVCTISPLPAANPDEGYKFITGIRLENEIKMLVNKDPDNGILGLRVVSLPTNGIYYYCVKENLSALCASEDYKFYYIDSWLSNPGIWSEDGDTRWTETSDGNLTEADIKAYKSYDTELQKAWKEGFWVETNSVITPYDAWVCTQKIAKRNINGSTKINCLR